MAVSSAPIVQSHISLPTRAEHINRIDHQINANITPTVFKDVVLPTDLMRVYRYVFGN